MQLRVRLACLALVGGLVGLLALGPAAGEGAQRLHIITTTTDLKSLAEEVGGDRGEVESLSRGYQDPHGVEVRPSYMLKLSRADLFVRIGLDHEPWVEPLLDGARNPRILPGAPGYVEASQAVEILEIPTGKVDRSMGDIHTAGNTHIWLDPENAKAMARTIADGLKRVAPADAATFDQNRLRFENRLEAALRGWTQKLAPYRGTKIVTYHSDLPYFARRFGLVVATHVESKPGIPPSPAAVAELIRRIRTEKIALLTYANYYDERLPKRIGEEAGIPALSVPLSVGGVKGVDNYLALIDYLVNTVAGALAAGPSARP